MDMESIHFDSRDWPIACDNVRRDGLGLIVSVSGRFVGLAAERLLAIRFADPPVVVGLEGRSYRFSSLDKDGSFTLVRHGW